MDLIDTPVMDIQEFLGWQIGERPVVNIKTGKIVNVVSGFSQDENGHLTKYNALKTEEERKAYLEEKRPSLWTRGFAPQGTDAYEFQGAGDIAWEACEDWVEINDVNMEKLKETNKDIWWEVRYTFLERRVLEMEFKFAQMGMAIT